MSMNIAIEEAFGFYKIDVEVAGSKQGPSTTQYELRRKRGTAINKIRSKINDISVDLGVEGVRLITNAEGIFLEIPKDERETVPFNKLLKSPDFASAKGSLPFVLGSDTQGQTVVSDLSDMPHTLIGGTTGSGKSVCINVMLCSLIANVSPDKLKLLLIDPKAVELTPYNGIPHMVCNAITKPDDALLALEWAVDEMEKRFALMEAAKVRKLSDYNKIVSDDMYIPSLVIVIDEMADLLMTSKAEAEAAICRIAQKARAAGIYLICCTQRPSADVITTKIRTNLPSRIGFAVSTAADSTIVMGATKMGADLLLGKGDGLFRPVGQNTPIRFQGAFISDSDVSDMIENIKGAYTSSSTTLTFNIEQYRADKEALRLYEIEIAEAQANEKKELASIKKIRAKIEFAYRMKDKHGVYMFA